MLQTQLHIGKQKPAVNCMTPIQNRAFIKPYGGIWTSTFLGEKEGSEWVQWCLSEQFGFGADGDFPAWLLYPIEHPNLFVVDSYADLEKAIESFGYPIYEGSSMVLLNYEKMVAAGFDGFHLTARGRWETHHSFPHNLYGYDCESTIWFRWAFEKVENLGVRQFAADWG